MFGKQIVFIFVAYGVVAAFFWFKAEWLANKISGKIVTLESDTTQKFVNIQTTCFTVIGVFLVVTALPEFFGAVVSTLLPSESLPDASTSTASLSLLVQSVIRLIIGLFLALRSSRLSQIIGVRIL
jgi:hypothetical protein